MKLCYRTLINTQISIKSLRFSTSRTTLNQVNDTFFTSLLSGRIQSLRDETGAIFIDRDPDLFSLILNYLRYSILMFISYNNNQKY